MKQFSHLEPGATARLSVEATVLERSGHQPLLNATLNLQSSLIESMTIREPCARILELFKTGFALWRIPKPSIASQIRTPTTLMNLAS